MEAMDLAFMKIGEKICIFKKSKQNQSILSIFLITSSALVLECVYARN